MRGEGSSGRAASRRRCSRPACSGAAASHEAARLRLRLRPAPPSRALRPPFPRSREPKRRRAPPQQPFDASVRRPPSHTDTTPPLFSSHCFAVVTPKFRTSSRSALSLQNKIALRVSTVDSSIRSRNEIGICNLAKSIPHNRQNCATLFSLAKRFVCCKIVVLFYLRSISRAVMCINILR